MSNDKLIDKIQKLLAMANGTDVQAEADTFLAKANELLLLHNLSLTDVELGGTENAVTEAKEARTYGDVEAEGKYEGALMHHIAKHNFCSTIITSYYNGGKLSVIGRPDNVEATLYMFDTARAGLRRISKKAYSAYRKEVLAQFEPREGETMAELEKCLKRSKQLRYRTIWIRSYLKGAVVGIARKLEAERQKATEGNASRYAIVLSKNNEAIKKYKADEYGELGQARATNTSNVDRTAFARGVQGGQNMNIAAGVNAAKTANALRLN